MKYILILCIACAIAILIASLAGYLKIRKHLHSEVYSSNRRYNIISSIYVMLMLFFLVAYIAFVVYLTRHSQYERIIYDICALLFFGSTFVRLSVSVLKQSLDVVLGVKLNERDTMTGLMSKSSFERKVQNVLESGSGKHVLAVIDLDKFKRINDVHGHAKGDEIIRAVAEIIRFSVRSEDIVGRFGGDEFLVLFREMSDNQVKMVIQRIEQAVIDEQNNLGCEVCGGISYGYVTIEGGSGMRYQEAFEKADHNLYCMKNKKCEIDGVQKKQDR